MDSKEYFGMTFDRLDEVVKKTCEEISSEKVRVDDGLAVLYSLIKARNHVGKELSDYLKSSSDSDDKNQTS